MNVLRTGYWGLLQLQATRQMFVSELTEEEYRELFLSEEYLSAGRRRPVSNDLAACWRLLIPASGYNLPVLPATRLWQFRPADR